jgi:ornithine cyclodeaminase/alanine dehydrogenase-like protein (mu-crystallin family)
MGIPEIGRSAATEAKRLLTVDAHEASRLLPMQALIDGLREFFVEGCEVPPRHHHTIAVPGQPEATLLLMPSWTQKSANDGYLGIKLVTVFPGNSARGFPALTSVYLLFDSGTGVQLATIDGNAITLRRTVATSALAASYLAREDAEYLLVLGSGRVASLLPEAYAAVRNIRRIGVWDINAESASRMVKGLVDAGLDAAVVSDLELGVRSADIVSSATLATSPLIKGEWLQPGVHIDLIGAFTPGMRESDDEAVRRSAVFVDTMEALHEAGDLVHPIKNGTFSPDDLRGSLPGLCKRETPGRRSPEEITMFKAVGTALADLAAASMVYKARTTEMPPQ